MSNIELIVKTLQKDGMNCGICSQGYAQLGLAQTKKELIRQYIRGIDFCFDNNFPKKEFIKQYFYPECECQGLYVEAGNVDIENALHTILIGKTYANITYNNYSVGRVYLKEEAQATISATDNAKVLSVDCFDSSQVKISCTGNAKVTVYLYGDSMCDIVAGKERVKIVKKDKNRYV